MKKNGTSKRRATKPAKPKRAAAPRVVPEDKNPPFPVVGIGASAGGLEALELFLKRVPPNSGLAFVIVQHLDPTHRDLMVELLQRVTAIPVEQIRDRTRIAPNRVYVIPPNRDLALLNGVLHLIEPATPRGLRLPIDFFFRSLATDLRTHSIGVILSGMGSDGTLGLRAIKQQGGASFVQDPASAKFAGMPSSAIGSGLADIVAPAQDLPDRIVAYLARVIPSLDRIESALTEQDQSALEKILILLRAQTGHDFSLYKKKTLYRRIERRMGLHAVLKIADYVRYLQSNPQETELLFKELLIGVTSFFRDPAVWEELKQDIFPALLAAAPKGKAFRAWVPACSTGEEVYSLAITFKEALDKLKAPGRYTLQIFATDLDKDAIEKARAGVYPSNIAADVSPDRLERFFLHEDERYRVKKEIREMAIFATQNLVMDPPFTKLDFLSCRNLLIYLEQDLQKKIIPLFHYSLNPGSILLLGSAETVGQNSALFTALPGKSRLYRRTLLSPNVNQVELPAVFARPKLSAPLDEAAIPPRKALPALADQLLLQHFAPAAVLINNNGDIVYINGKTGKYLEPAAGKTNWNIFAMARAGLDRVLPEVVRQAITKKRTLTLPSVRIGTNGGTQIVDLIVKPVTEPDGLRGMILVVFADVAAPLTPAALPARKGTRSSNRDQQLATAERLLRRARDELQAAHEERQTSQEELKSTNEELQSTNEELQSTNEELTTSKEEMQSMNEELQTVNQELQGKVDELSWASNDMKNLLNSTDIATVFLDEQLRLRRFTTLTAKIIRLIASDIGRPITHITTDLDYPALVDDVQSVMQTLVFKETPVSTHDGRWFNVRIMPYRTHDNRIDGVVITFVDITGAKKMETELRTTQARLAELLKCESENKVPINSSPPSP